jgi:hypothetical protein
LGAKSREKVTLRGKKRCKNSDLAWFLTRI